MADVKSSVFDLKASLDTEWLETYNAFSKVKEVVENALQRSLQSVEERRERVNGERDALLQGLDREILELQYTIKLMEINPDLQIPLDVARRTSLDTSFSFGTVRSVTSALIEQVELQLDELSSSELRRFPAFAVDVKLDPSTAHHCLKITVDGKKVQGGGRHYAEVIPKSVLGLNGLKGMAYWEVEVSSKPGWFLGVAGRDANRRWSVWLSPENGHWLINYTGLKNMTALAAPRVNLTLRGEPQMVGVFVNYKEGLVSFYDKTARAHIYSFRKC